MGEARGGRQSSFIAGCRAAQQHEWSPSRRFVSAKRASPGGSARASHSASLLAYRSPLCARGFTCHMPRMHAQARAQVWRQHACKTHASAHYSALLAQEGAPLWGRRSGACSCSSQRSTCPGGRAALGSALRGPRAPGSRSAPPHPRLRRALAPWASWRA